MNPPEQMDLRAALCTQTHSLVLDSELGRNTNADSMHPFVHSCLLA